MSKNPVIVVIDDEILLCELWRKRFREEGYRTVVALDVNNGLYLVKALHPKVVIVNISILDMNGIDVVGEIFEIDSSILKIFITGYSSVFSTVELKKIGAFDYLSKPFAPEQILEYINRGKKLWQIKEESKIVEDTLSIM